MKESHLKNNIDVLYDQTGKKLTTTEEIKGEVSNFYKTLIGTAAYSLEGIDVQIVRKGKQLTVVAAESLVLHVTEAEIDNALKQIDAHKAPGLDGFNSMFFLKPWNIVKPIIYEAVKEFFRIGVLLKQINNTSVTLIPKFRMLQK